MAGIVPHEEQSRSLSRKVGKTGSAGDTQIHLMTSNTTPTEATVVGDLTLASGSGADPKTLTGASWTVSGTNPVQATYAEQSWTLTGSLTVYGYAITRAAGAELVHVQRDDAAPRSFVADDIVRITPTITEDGA